MIKLITKISIIALLVGCSTTDGFFSKKKKVLTNAMSVKEKVDLALEADKGLLTKIQNNLAESNQVKEAAKYISTRLYGKLNNIPVPAVINAMHIYLGSPIYSEYKVANNLINNKKIVISSLGWMLVSVMPTNQRTREFIESKIDSEIIGDNIDKLMIPAMAEALGIHQIKNSYDLLRLGLMRTGNPLFAQNMLKINPTKSGPDFISYLALASGIELRQRSFKSVNAITCMVILDHLIVNEIDVSTPQFEHLFYYTVSRNQLLAQRAAVVIQKYLPKHQKYLAIKLSRMKAWIQVAFLTTSKRSMTPKLGRFLFELKDLTAQKYIADEIEQIRF